MGVDRGSVLMEPTATAAGGADYVAEVLVVGRRLRGVMIKGRHHDVFACLFRQQLKMVYGLNGERYHTQRYGCTVERYTAVHHTRTKKIRWACPPTWTLLSPPTTAHGAEWLSFLDFARIQRLKTRTEDDRPCYGTSAKVKKCPVLISELS